MKREDLKALGLEDSVIDTIMAENGKDIEKHKKDAETATLKATGLETQLTDVNKKMESFKDLDVDAIKKEASDWKVAAEKAKTDAQEAIDKIQFDHALDGALSGAKAKSSKAVKALLDMGGLKINNGEIVGLKEQLEKIKTDNDYLFESEEGTPTIVKGTPGASVTGDAAVRTAMGLPPLKE